MADDVGLGETTEKTPSVLTTVVSRLEVQGSSAIPGRHNHTVAGAADELPDEVAAVPSATAKMGMSTPNRWPRQRRGPADRPGLCDALPSHPGRLMKTD